MCRTGLFLEKRCNSDTFRPAGPRDEEKVLKVCYSDSCDIKAEMSLNAVLEVLGKHTGGEPGFKPSS